MLLGGALAGFVIGLWGAQVAFIADSVTFFVSAAAVMTVAVPRTTKGQQAAGGQIAAVWAEMVEGVIYLFGNRTMVGVLLCLGVTQFGIGAIQVLWVPFLQRTFGVGAKGVGIVDSVQGGGMIVGGLMLQAGWSQPSLKLLLIMVFMLLTGPTASHALAKSSLHGHLKPLLRVTKEIDS